MDALSEALRSVRMTGAIFLDAEFTAPWSFRSPRAQQAAPVVAPGTEQLIIYHLVIEGMAWVKMAGEPDLPVEAGEIVIIPHGEEHLFGNGTPDTVFDGGATLHRHVAGELSSLRWGGGGVRTKFVCGFMGCERQAESLFLAGLPTTIKINIRGDASGAWLENSIRYLVSEGQLHQPGRNILLSKMAEALFIETLRCYIKLLPPEATGWLAGARDPIAGAALALLHRRPAEHWTIDRLAGDIGTSRSVLSDRFTRYLGNPPLTYLARWRMQLASRMLQTTKATVLQVGLAVGYESEAAFVRAFKREFGLPPARYRKSLSESTIQNLSS
ncbi:MAG: AraC family transcriptional regulator [Hyphomicrobiaceae bacterium]|jgi:AraC-like DNA-binding protein